MKKTLFLASALMLSVGVKAQTYFFENFSSGGTGWTNIDKDGDGHKWSFVDFQSGDDQGKVANSQSWDSNDGPLHPNNYLISSAIVLGSTNLTLHYKVKGQDPSYSQEHYAVYVTTANDTVTINASTPVIEETLPSNTTDYINKTVDLSAFSGQTVYLTFRHFNVSDMFSMNIDDIVIGKIQDVMIQSSSVASGVQPGNVSITGTVKNVGTETIDSLFLSYDAGAGTITDTVAGLNIASGATYNFTHPTPLVTVAGQSYSLNICASTPNDAVAANNCTNDKINFVITLANSADKYVVVEEKTGTWCGYCPYGTVALDELHNDEPKAIEIAIHNDDPMAITAYDSGSENFPAFDGYPYSAIDRVIGDHAAYSAQHVNERKPVLAPASISFDDASLSGNTITVTPKVSMVTDMSGDYRLAVVLIEEQVKGSSSTDNSWKQHNYFTTSLNNTDLISPDGTNWKNLPEYVDQVAVFGGYNHVARALGNNAINGDAGSLPATLTNAQSYTHTYTFTKGATWVVSNMHAVAMFIDNSTGEIFNAMQTPITGVAGISENSLAENAVAVYPNPSNGSANIKVSLENESTVSFNVVNMLGETVYTAPAEKLAAGTKVYALDLNVNSGVYFAHVTVNGKTQIIKMNIVK
jgi:hypothetical protein